MTPSWLKEGNYQIESRGRKYEVDFVIKKSNDLTFYSTWAGGLSAVRNVPFRFS